MAPVLLVLRIDIVMMVRLVMAKRPVMQTTSVRTAPPLCVVMADACNGVETCDDNTGECVDGENPCLATEAIDICVATTADPGYECQEVACIENSDCSGDTPYWFNNICVACMSDAHCDDNGACNGIETCTSLQGRVNRVARSSVTMRMLVTVSKLVTM